jgi:hypothetical protein
VFVPREDVDRMVTASATKNDLSRIPSVTTISPIEELANLDVQVNGTTKVRSGTWAS